MRKFCNLDPPLRSPLMPTTMGEACTANASSPYISIASGIFAYLNYLVSQKRLYVLETLINGLKRLEYRGYDSAGVCRGRDVRACTCRAAGRRSGLYIVASGCTLSLPY